MSNPLRRTALGLALALGCALTARAQDADLDQQRSEVIEPQLFLHFVVVESLHEDTRDSGRASGGRQAHELGGVRGVGGKDDGGAVAVDNQLLRFQLPVGERLEQPLERFADGGAALHVAEHRTRHLAVGRVEIGERGDVLIRPRGMPSIEEPGRLVVCHRGPRCSMGRHPPPLG